MPRFRIYLLAAIVLVLPAIMADRAAYAGYQISKLYDSSLPVLGPGATWFPSFFAWPACNNSGEVAFGASQLVFGGPSTPNGLYIGNGGAPTMLLPDVNLYTTGISLNNLGEVAFQGDIPAGTGVVKVSGGVTTLVSDPIPLHDYGVWMQMNDAGNIVFDAVPVSGPQDRTGYIANENSLTPLGSAFGTSINESGVVAVGRNGEIVAIPPAGPTSVLATPVAPIIVLLDPKLNNSGDLLALGLESGGQTGLYSIHEGVASLIGPGTAVASLNNSGHFAAWTTLGGVNGIYTGTTGVTDYAVRVGDTLFGSTITELGFSADGLNDLGQVAFYYRLQNGVTGIALATPVPEPASLVFAGMSLLSLFLVASRRKFRRQH